MRKDAGEAASLRHPTSTLFLRREVRGCEPRRFSGQGARKVRFIARTVVADATHGRARSGCGWSTRIFVVACAPWRCDDGVYAWAKARMRLPFRHAIARMNTESRILCAARCRGCDTRQGQQRMLMGRAHLCRWSRAEPPSRSFIDRGSHPHRRGIAGRGGPEKFPSRGCRHTFALSCASCRCWVTTDWCAGTAGLLCWMARGWGA